MYLVVEQVVRGVLGCWSFGVIYAKMSGCED